MGTIGAFLARRSHKLILSLGPFTLALAETFLEVSRAESGRLLFIDYLTHPISSFVMLVNHPLTIPFQSPFLHIGLWKKHADFPTLLGTYVIAFIYAIVLYAILSLKERISRRTDRGTRIVPRQQRAARAILWYFKPTSLKITCAVVPFLAAVSYTYVEILSKVDPGPLPAPLESLAVWALGVTIFISIPASAPFEVPLSAVGLWDRWTSFPSHVGLYVVACVYSIAIYSTFSLLNAIRGKWSE